MPIRLRQIAIAAAELEPTVDLLCAVLGLEVAHNDPAVEIFGLHNALMPVGGDFLEVVSPIKPNTTVGRLIERVGDTTGYMAIFQADSLDEVRRRVAEQNVRVAWEADLGEAETIHLHPKDIGGAVVSFDRMPNWEGWLWAGPEWRPGMGQGQKNVTGIAGIELCVSQPEAKASRWAAITGGMVDGGASEVSIGTSLLRFLPSESSDERLSTLLLEAHEPTRILERARDSGLATETDRFQIGALRIKLAPSRTEA